MHQRLRRLLRQNTEQPRRHMHRRQLMLTDQPRQSPRVHR
ncbi:hypothetical protein, partial [Streptomyces jumonjinensis]